MSSDSHPVIVRDPDGTIHVWSHDDTGEHEVFVADDIAQAEHWVVDVDRKLNRMKQQPSRRCEVET